MGIEQKRGGDALQELINSLFGMQQLVSSRKTNPAQQTQAQNQQPDLHRAIADWRRHGLVRDLGRTNGPLAGSRPTGHRHRRDNRATTTVDQIPYVPLDFGDPAGRHNQSAGFNAAHLYQQPGSYTITGTLISESGPAGATTAAPSTIYQATIFRRPRHAIGNLRRQHRQRPKRRHGRRRWPRWPPPRQGLARAPICSCTPATRSPSRPRSSLSIGDRIEHSEAMFRPRFNTCRRRWRIRRRQNLLRQRHPQHDVHR